MCRRQRFSKNKVFEGDRGETGDGGGGDGGGGEVFQVEGEKDRTERLGLIF